MSRGESLSQFLSRVIRDVISRKNHALIVASDEEKVHFDHCFDNSRVNDFFIQISRSINERDWRFVLKTNIGKWDTEEFTHTVTQSEGKKAFPSHDDVKQCRHSCVLGKSNTCPFFTVKILYPPQNTCSLHVPNEKKQSNGRDLTGRREKKMLSHWQNPKKVSLW